MPKPAKATPASSFDDYLLHRQYRLSVEQYDEMIRRGILAEDLQFELIQGHIVSKNRAAQGENVMSIGTRHVYAVDQLGELKPTARELGLTLRTQQPIALVGSLSKPEPDGYLLAGSNDDFMDVDATAADVLVVFEVADSSLEFDRTTKLALYAAAGIATYVIINLVNKTAEVYTKPNVALNIASYATKVVLTRRQTLSLSLAKKKTFKIQLSKLIPA